MLVVCGECDSGYQITEQLGGRMSRCRCGERIAIPIRNADKLIEWACSTPYRRLRNFVNAGGARGHDSKIVDRVVEMLIHKRTEIIEANERTEAARLASEKEKRRLAARKRHREQVQALFDQNQQIEQLLQLSAKAFEHLIAAALRAEGYEAAPVGQSADGGVDVAVSGRDGESNYAVAQCKRFHPDIAVGSPAIQRIAGAYLQSNANLAFFFTTSRFSSYAVKAASDFGWLELYDGPRLVDWLQAIAAGKRGRLTHKGGMIDPYYDNQA